MEKKSNIMISLSVYMKIYYAYINIHECTASLSQIHCSVCVKQYKAATPKVCFYNSIVLEHVAA